MDKSDFTRLNHESMVCMWCGAMVASNSYFDMVQQHIDFHMRLDYYIENLNDVVFKLDEDVADLKEKNGINSH